MFKKVFQWIIYSSADPSKVSLTIKSVGVLLVSWLIPIIGLTHVNLGGDPSATLNGLVDAFAQLVQALLALVGAIAGAYGLIRKVYLTTTGKNA